MNPIYILTGAPIWVWPLLALLVFIGLRATQPRTFPAWPLYFLPLLGLLPVNAVNGLSPAPMIWVAFLCAYGAGVAFGYWFQARVVVSKTAKDVSSRGEYVTLIALMVVFWMNFVAGLFQAVAPAMYASSGFHMAFATLAGIAAGSFGGRALRVLLMPQQ